MSIINIEKYDKLLAFVKKVNNGYCFSDTDDQALQKLVDYEMDAEELLKEIGDS